MNKLICGDCLKKLKELSDNSIDSIITDPPYGIGFMGKKWDKFRQDKRTKNQIVNLGSGMVFPKLLELKEFQEWCELWAKECLRILKPGGHLFSFGGTRTYHRMACAIEDAGFEVRDMIEWVYGSGFPKSLNIGKAIQKREGELKIKGYEPQFPDGTRGATYRGQASTDNELSFTSKDTTTGGLKPIYEINNEWEGWGTVLKPSHEPICLARKPLSEKSVAENVLKWKIGGINIDESRVEMPQMEKDESYRKPLETIREGFVKTTKPEYNPTQGRFPANLIHDNSEEVRECFPETKTHGGGKQNTHSKNNWFGNSDNREIGKWNSGNASRFFKSIIYTAKASKSERNLGLDSIVLLDIMEVWKENNITKEEKLIRFVVSGLSPEKVIVESGTAKKNGNEWSMFLFGKSLMEKYQKDTGLITKMETNSITVLQIWNYLMHLLTKGYIQGVKLETATGGNLVGNAENYSELIISINEKVASLLGVKNVVSKTQLKISVKEGSNFHSTVKPIALMEYLIKMVTPKGGIVLDPFAGSGSTLIAAKKNGFNFIGIEKEIEYCRIAEARLNSTNKRLQQEVMEF